ncbi:MAG: cohesin domain-containing protein [Oscillospiraceae bacterium]|nr:cohesin domain-containing protein [Oscillospiraceae bacterium]
MGTLKKTAAIICSAATLAFAGLSATVFAYDTVKLENRAEELNSGKMMYVADEVYAAAGETVDYTVYVQNNDGYTSGGIAMYYDPALEVVMADSIKAYCVKGSGAEGLAATHSLNKEANIFGFSVMGTEDCKFDGKVYTIRFTVPADAQPGSTYPIKLEVVEMLNRKGTLVDCTTVAGWIKVPDVIAATTSTTNIVLTTTAAPTVSTSTVISTTTAVPPIPENTTTTTTASPVQPDGSTTTTAAQILGTTTTTVSERHTERITDDTKHNAGDDEQTTASRNNGGSNSTTPTPGKKTEATKTGDSGVAVAFAALMIAGVSAVVCRRKK